MSVSPISTLPMIPPVPALAMPSTTSMASASVNGSTSAELFSASEVSQAVGSSALSLQGVASISAPVSTSPAVPATAPFADLLQGAIGQIEGLEKQAKSAVEGLMSGTGVDVHQAMIATEKAEMGFELMLSVRNKALAAYQQVLGMQF